MSLELEQHLAALLGMEHVTLYPTGWAAGYGAIAAFVRPRDHIVMDYLCHACLQQGAASATPQIKHFIHNDAEDLKARLQSIRAKDARNGIMVITEGLFAMESDAPDLAAFQDACSEYGATLLVDVAHDLGAMGPGGGGMIAAQGLARQGRSGDGQLRQDLRVQRRLSRLALAGREAVRQVLRQSAHVLERAVAGAGGRRLGGHPHRPLAEGDDAARAPARARRTPCATASPRRGSPASARRRRPCSCPSATTGWPAWHRAASPKAGVFVNLVEYPAVPVDHARLSMQVMATHESAQIEQSVQRIIEARRLAEQDLKVWRAGAGG